MESPPREPSLIDRPAPDVHPLDPEGRPYSTRSRVGIGPLVLFFYIRNSTPG
jgi:hypothetical protein